MFTIAMWMAGCAPESSGDTLWVHSTTGTEEGGSLIQAIERTDEGGPYIPGGEASFRAVTSPGVKVTWLASDGSTLDDGDAVLWELPHGQYATLYAIAEGADGTVQRAEYSIMLAAMAPAAVGAIAPNEPGSRCAMAFDSADVPHVIWRSNEHSQWKYSKYSNGWTNELIDGPGFGVGGVAGFGRPAIALDRNRVPHVAFTRDNGELMYANRVGGSWTLTRLATDAGLGLPVAIVLDTFNADAPIVMADDNATSKPEVYRLNAGVWTTTTMANAVSGARYHGGLTLTAAATVKFPYGSETVYQATWSAANGFSAIKTVHPYVNWSIEPLEIIAPTAQKVGVVDRGTLWWTTNGGGAWSEYPLHEFDSDASSIVWDGANPVVVTTHSSRVEVVRPNTRSYWTYTDTGALSDSQGENFSVAKDSAGGIHFCHVWNNLINVY